MKKLSVSLCFFIILILIGSGEANAELITVAAGGRYFQQGDSAFLIIGPNDALTWPGLSPLLGNVSPKAAEAYLQKLADHGINTVRVMLEYAQTPNGLLENPIGEYRTDVVEFWDTFFNWLEKYGIYAIVTPWDPFWMERTWSDNPYNRKNGGMMVSMNGFLTNPEAKEAQKERFQFAIARWGHSKQILAWELMNEIELWWGAASYEVDQWISEMASFVREKQLEYHGFCQLLTVSTANSAPSGSLGHVVYNHPELDFANTHLYTGPGMNAPRNTTDVTEEVGAAVNYALWMIKDRRPYTDTESGPIEMWIGSPRFDAEFLHNVSWTHLASGGAGTGMRWPYRTPHILHDEMLMVLKRISVFVDEFDFSGFSPENISPDLLVPVDHHVVGVGDDRRLLIWTVHDSRIQGDPQPVEVDFDYVSPGTYRVKFWDTWEAKWLEENTVEFSKSSGTITTPPFSKDIAIVLERIDEQD